MRKRIEDWRSGVGADLVRSWLMGGLSDGEVAERIGISETTLLRWRAADEDFRRLFEWRRELVEARIEVALVEKALGGSVSAQQFWLRSRGLGYCGKAEDIVEDFRGIGEGREIEN